jgi:hypothetical protein
MTIPISCHGGLGQKVGQRPRAILQALDFRQLFGQISVARQVSRDAGNDER